VKKWGKSPVISHTSRFKLVSEPLDPIELSVWCVGPVGHTLSHTARLPIVSHSLHLHCTWSLLVATATRTGQRPAIWQNLVVFLPATKGRVQRHDDGWTICKFVLATPNPPTWLVESSGIAWHAYPSEACKLHDVHACASPGIYLLGWLDVAVGHRYFSPSEMAYVDPSVWDGRTVACI
jgi:hypothetical protein